jgi:hypothetical protein
MSTIIAKRNPRAFKTLPLFVEASPEGLSYQALGQPLNFSQMLERRRPVEVADSQRFALELANLGVSVRLTLTWQGRDYWLLVRQQRQDRGDVVLKPISGYVPAHELNLPLLTAIQEVAEECLLQTPQCWLTGRFGDTWLPAPYENVLHYCDNTSFRLSPLSGAARPVSCGSMPLLERPRAYVHLPTASLQLVYDMRLEMPGNLRQLSLLHADECLEEGTLIARIDHDSPDLYLLPFDQDRRPADELYTLQQGILHPVDTRDLWLAESFAPQDGWVVRDERISWRDWQALWDAPEQNLARPAPRRSGAVG